MPSTLLTGYYNKKNVIENPNNNIATTVAWLEQYPNNTTIIAIQSYRIPASITVAFYEVYTWITYNDYNFTVKLGEITYNSFYPDNGTGISTQTMTVLGADGIYSGVKSVIMDFTDPSIRIIKFNY